MPSHVLLWKALVQLGGWLLILTINCLWYAHSITMIVPASTQPLIIPSYVIRNSAANKCSKCLHSLCHNLCSHLPYNKPLAQASPLSHQHVALVQARHASIEGSPQQALLPLHSTKAYHTSLFFHNRLTQQSQQTYTRVNTDYEVIWNW
jgi:hypothetical protein